MIPQSWTKGFDVAKAASQHAIAPRIGQRLGSAIFSKSRLLSIGWNSYATTHPDADNTHLFARNLHAEHRALLKIRHYDNRNLVIYVYRETSNGKPACSLPCYNCRYLLKIAGIDRARFIDSEGKMSELSL